MSHRDTASLTAVLFLALLIAAPPLAAGFADTDVLIPAVARAPGLYGSDFYSQIWVTNLSSSPLNVDLAFLQRDVSNTSPRVFSVTLASGETRRFDNAVETLFGVSGTSGAVRVTSAGPILVSSRTYNLPPGGSPSDGQGLFFTGIPCSFAIGIGEAAQLQGVTQGAENFRYNFGLVNISPGAATVRVQLRDPSGNPLGEKSYDVPAYGALQYAATDVVPDLSTANALLWATVVGGTGRVILYGTQIANGSNDSAGFEMSFKNSLLAAGGGVTSLNGMTGDVSLAAGSNVTLTRSGNTLAIAAGGGGGGLTLPYAGSASNVSYVFKVTNTGAGDTVVGIATLGGGPAGVVGQNTASGTVGSLGGPMRAVDGYATASNTGVRGQSPDGDGVQGVATNSGRGVHGFSQANDGVFGESTNGEGIHGKSTNQDGVFGEASASLKSGVYAINYNAAGFAAYFGGHVYVHGAFDVSAGTKNFLIDHPVDPENKVLRHAAIESSEVLDVYSGNVVLDAAGAAVVHLPGWLEALNRDFRYSLTAIGAPAPDLHVGERVANGRFRIAGGKPGLEVSWQITGVRNDAWMRAHPFVVEEEKPREERGSYLTPAEHGQPPERDVEWVRRSDLMKRLAEERRAADGGGTR